jgi:hypothetical protein
VTKHYVLILVLVAASAMTAATSWTIMLSHLLSFTVSLVGYKLLEQVPFDGSSPMMMAMILLFIFTTVYMCQWLLCVS